jgi:type VI protein secretion system component VasF
MIESASREIQRAVEAAETRRRDAASVPALIAALDDLLNELEELTVGGIAEAPDALRHRAAELIAEAMRLEDVPAVPGTIADLMERA